MRKAILRCISLQVFLFCLVFICQGQASSPWQSEFDKFDQLDKQNEIEDDSTILFTGSSSIRKWQHPELDFDNPHILNRGFGGSQIIDLIENFKRIILKYHPSTVVIYSGDNDIASGKSPEVVYGDLCVFLGMLHSELPDVKVVYISIKPSIARWNIWPSMNKTNQLIKNYLVSNNLGTYVDVSALMIQNGTPDKSLFIQDGLHMNAKGYEVWKNTLTPYIK